MFDSEKINKLPRSFYQQRSETVARQLLGQLLVRQVNGHQKIGRIVEVEAYLGQHDLACHASKGVTKRTKTMYGPAGYAYIYLIYGMYYCTNIVTEQEGCGAAVLIRALEPVKNINDKTSGPGLLSRAMDITCALNGYDLMSHDFFIASAPMPDKEAIIARPRIGVDYAGDWAKKNLRFYINNNPFISKK